jgi:hypothetical protein
VEPRPRVRSCDEIQAIIERDRLQRALKYIEIVVRPDGQ